MKLPEGIHESEHKQERKKGVVTYWFVTHGQRRIQMTARFQ